VWIKGQNKKKFALHFLPKTTLSIGRQPQKFPDSVKLRIKDWPKGRGERLNVSDNSFA